LLKVNKNTYPKGRALMQMYNGGVAQWLAFLTRYRWKPFRRE